MVTIHHKMSAWSCFIAMTLVHIIEFFWRREMEHICKEQLATSLINLGINTAVAVNKHLKERKSQNKQTK